VREASESFLREAHPHELNYGVLQGDERFLGSLARYLEGAYGSPVDPSSLFVSGGNSQALDLVSTLFSKPGDTVFVEEPSYFLAFQIFRDHGLKLVGVPTDGDGMRMDALEALLADHDPTLVYTIPSYHNPGGHCLSASRRTRLVELSREHGFLVVADEVYQLLNYSGEPPPALGTMVESDTVLSLGSFSKILAPALRLGWIQTGPTLRQRLVEGGFINSGGSLNHYASHIVRHAMEGGSLATHVEELRGAYGRRVEAMEKALQSDFEGLATWSRPEGGYFFWLRFRAEVDTGLYRERARELETGFQPGSLFSCQGRHRDCLRLSFAHYGEEDITEGVGRLREVFSEVD
jgi:DNA-binding transcriptional MocR family regulator